MYVNFILCHGRHPVYAFASAVCRFAMYVSISIKQTFTVLPSVLPFASADDLRFKVLFFALQRKKAETEGSEHIGQPDRISMRLWRLASSSSSLYSALSVARSAFECCFWTLGGAGQVASGNSVPTRKVSLGQKSLLHALSPPNPPYCWGLISEFQSLCPYSLRRTERVSNQTHT